MHDFTPVHALVGGALIALALAVVLLTTGRIAGLSGIIAGVLRVDADWSWRVWFVAGMVGVGAVFQLAQPATFDHGSRVPLPLVGIAGAIVGFGTRLCNGCTSGHGLCGASRLSKRSIIATGVFFSVAVVTATAVGAACGG